MVTDIEKLDGDLREVLSKERYSHSVCVMQMCEKLAKKYNANVEKAKLIGLMHDMAKELSKKEKLDYVKKNNIACNEIEKKLTGILHGKIAADMCKKKYGFDDEMCEAIAVHTTGKPNMTILQKILFIADKTDESRTYDGIVELRNLAFENIDKAIIKNLDSTLLINIDKGNLIFEESIKTRNYLLLSSENKKIM